MAVIILVAAMGVVAWIMGGKRGGQIEGSKTPTEAVSKGAAAAVYSLIGSTLLIMAILLYLISLMEALPHG